MKRNLIYLLILLLLAYLVYHFVIEKQGGTLKRDEKNFAIEDTTGISKIFIADMTGKKITIERTGKIWVMNQKFSARNDAVNLILSTLKSLAVRYPVPDAARNTVIKDMAGMSRKIEVYNKEGEKIQSFYIGNAPADSKGNFMLIEGSQTPFVVEVPGFVGSLETRFIIDETEFRSRNIISIPFPSLAEISVNYADNYDLSFAINVQTPDSFLIYNPGSKKSLAAKEIDKEKVFQYIDFLKQVNCEAYENNNSKKDSIMMNGLFAVVNILKRNNENIQIKLFHKPITERSKIQFDEKGMPLIYDRDRFYGLVNNGNDFVLLQQYHFGNLLKDLNYFRK